MRLFLAAPIPAAARARLGALAAALCRGMERGRPTRPENLHLTLHFLGEADPRAAERAVRAVAFSRFALDVSHLGSFRQQGGDVVWAGVGDSPALLALHGALGDALRREGFAPDERPFRPHVTLVRRARPGGRDWSTVGRAQLPVRVEVAWVVLMESVIGADEVRYRALCAQRSRD